MSIEVEAVEPEGPKGVLVDASGKETPITCEYFVRNREIWKFEVYPQGRSEDRIECMKDWKKHSKTRHPTVSVCLQRWLGRKAENAPKEREAEVLSEEAYAKAEQLLTNGDPLEHILEPIALLHAGDQQAAQIEWISALSSRLSKVKINSWLIGKTQKGKSHLKYTVLQILPKELYELFTSASPLSLFYYVKKYGEDALNGVLLYIDEVETSKYSLPMLRSLTGQTDILPRHLSVHEAEVLDFKIVGGRAVWFTSVKTFGKQQIKNRFIHTNPDESTSQDQRVWLLQDKTYREGVETPTEPFDVAKALTQIIIRETESLRVKIPYGVVWPFKNRRQLYPVFIAVITVITKARFKKRKREGDQLIAEADDFLTAKNLWTAFKDIITKRVGKSALEVLDHIPKQESSAITHAELSRTLPISTRQIENLCSELLEEGLVNAQKRSASRGRPAWEYWQKEQPTVEDIGMEFIEGSLPLILRNNETQRENNFSKKHSPKKLRYFGKSNLTPKKEAHSTPKMPTEKAAPTKTTPPSNAFEGETVMCHLCNKPLPAGLKNTTVLDGKNVHINCFFRGSKGERSCGSCRHCNPTVSDYRPYCDKQRAFVEEAIKCEWWKKG